MNIDQAGSTADQSFGLMRIGGALLALAAESIREVIPGQSSYSPLPVRAEGLLGGVDIRGTIIPVLDLRHTLGLPPGDRVEQVIVIMRWQEHLIGLTADDVLGIARVPEKALFTLKIADSKSGSALVTHTFQNNGTIATVLDAQRIAELPNIPMVAEKQPLKGSGLSTGTESILLFSCDSSQFGIDATCVDAAVPTIKIERNALTTGYCLGVIGHHGYDVPVVDTRVAIGLAAAGKPPIEATVIVIRFGESAMLGFAIDAVRDIVRVAASDILQMPSLETEETSLFRGILVDAKGRQNLLLDADQIRANPQFRLLAGFRKPRIALERGDSERIGTLGTTAGVKAETRTEPFLTYVAVSEQASPLDQVTEILNYPADVAPFASQGSGMLGLFTHRGRVTPLVCLATVLGRPSAFDPDKARVLFVENAGKMIGFVVEALLSIEAATRHDPPPSQKGESHNRFRSLVMIGRGDQRRMVSNIDLIGEVAHFYRERGHASFVAAQAALPIATAV